MAGRVNDHGDRITIEDEQTVLSETLHSCLFSEITTFHVPPCSAIENEGRKEGKWWANLVRMYAEHPGTKLLWWGLRLDDPSVVKLVVDWTDVENLRLFQQSPDFQGLEDPPGVKAENRRFYDFDSYDLERHDAFTNSSWTNVVSAILTFNFSSLLDPFKEKRWDLAWNRFSQAALESQGGTVPSEICAGWAEDHLSFCGVFKHKDIASMKLFLLGDPPSLRKLKRIATGQMEVEFTSVYCLEDGWLDSVTRTKRDVPGVIPSVDDWWELQVNIQESDRIEYEATVGSETFEYPQGSGGK